MINGRISNMTNLMFVIALCLETSFDKLTDALDKHGLIHKHKWEYLEVKGNHHRKCTSCPKEQVFEFVPGTGGKKEYLAIEYVRRIWRARQLGISDISQVN
jgi:hypothetical protein